MNMWRRLRDWVHRMRHRGVRAEQFVLVDCHGRERAALEMDADRNVKLTFRDDSGGVRLHLGLAEDGTPRVDLRYAGGRGSLQLEANDKLNTAGLIIAGPSGTAQILLGVARNGAPAIALFNERGELLYPGGHQGKKKTREDGPEGFDWDSILRQ